MNRLSTLAALLPILLVACAVETTSTEGEGTPPETPAEKKAEPKAPGAIAETPATDQRVGGPTPFCLPGEKVVCTLGPPPVCHCAPEVPPSLPIGAFQP